MAEFQPPEGLRKIVREALTEPCETCSAAGVLGDMPCWDCSGEKRVLGPEDGLVDAVLAALFDACEVREEWGVRSAAPEREIPDYWRESRAQAEATIAARSNLNARIRSSLIRRYVLTTPPAARTDPDPTKETAAMPDQTTKLPDQPDGIDEQTRDLPDPARAAERVREYIAATGDGLYDVQGGAPLYGRDLEAVTRTAAQLADAQEQLARTQHDLDQTRRELDTTRAEADQAIALLGKVLTAPAPVPSRRAQEQAVIRAAIAWRKLWATTVLAAPEVRALVKAVDALPAGESQATALAPADTPTAQGAAA